MSFAPHPSTVSRPGLPAVLAGLCVTQIIGWGVLYYGFAVLAPTISADTGWSPSWTMAAFSAALVVAALVGIPVGRVLDKRGPHLVMTGGSVLASAAVLVVANAPNLIVFALGWVLAGVAMAGVLYQPAFAAVTGWFGERRLMALTAITLVAGLASTVFAPLTAALAAAMSWREVYLVLAGVLAVTTIPIHATVLRRPWPREVSAAAGSTEDDAYVRGVVRSRHFVMMLGGLTLGALATYAVLINLVPLVESRGLDSTTAAWVLGIGGVGQVAGRLVYAPLAVRVGVRTRTVLIYGMSALGTAGFALIAGPVGALIAVALVAGVARGIQTLLQATAIPDRWGSRSYGRINGIVGAPTTLVGAVAPWIGATVATATGSYPLAFGMLAVAGAVATALLAFSIPRQIPGR